MQGTGKWLSVKTSGHLLTPDVHFEISTGENISESGSYLPLSSTLIWGRVTIGSVAIPFVDYTATRTSKNPTFIPHRSALDLDLRGTSKFTTVISSQFNHFHDTVPDDIVEKLMSNLELQKTVTENVIWSISEIGQNVIVLVKENTTLTIQSGGEINK
jgi:hypothetical protein